jgi:hypothetical protein
MFAIRWRRRFALMPVAALTAFGIGIFAAPCGQAADEPAATANVRPMDGSSAPARTSSPKPPPTAPAPAPHIEGGQVSGRWREGSRLIDQLGYFKLTGDRVTFVASDGKLKFDGLENLAVERIARTIGDNPDQLEWTVSGIITEFRGTNYLLVTQAVLKTKATRSRRAP